MLHTRLLSFLFFLFTSETRTVRWYSGWNLTYDVKFANKYSNAITGWYPLEREYWNSILPHINGSITTPNATSYEIYKKNVQILRYPVENQKFTVHGVTGSFNADFIMSNRSLLAIPSIVSHVKNAGLDGYLIDFEPQHTPYHSNDMARNFSNFIHALGKAMHAKRLELGIDVANFGPISVNQAFFDQYAVGSSVDFFTLMSPTYFGTDVANDEVFAEKLRLKVGRERARIGVASMPAQNTTSGYYNWTESKLNQFTKYLKSRDFEHIDIWPCSLSGCPGHESEIVSWFFKPLANFLKS